MTDDGAGTGPALLTTRQVAERFDVNIRTVNRWVREGRLPVAVATLGGDARFDPAVVEALAADALAAKVRR
jgi:excisionase family DNA binding protein